MTLGRNCRGGCVLWKDLTRGWVDIRGREKKGKEALGLAKSETQIILLPKETIDFPKFSSFLIIPDDLII